MTEIESQLLQALLDVEAAVKAMPTANPKPNLVQLFSKIDDLASRLPKTTAPELQHYLQKKSYQKARYFLQGREDENAAGNCGHV